MDDSKMIKRGEAFHYAIIDGEFVRVETREDAPGPYYKVRSSHSEDGVIRFEAVDEETDDQS